MANKITWTDKTTFRTKPAVPDEQKVTAADMNAVKTSVNEVIDEMPSNLVNGIAEGSARMINALDQENSYLGRSAFAEGVYTRATEFTAHAEGYYTSATGNYSHVEGLFCSASGEASHAEGQSTIATGPYQHVQGMSNIPKEGYAHIVGNGTVGQSNCHTLDWEGNAWFAGEVYVGSDNGTDKDGGSVTLEKTSNKITDITLEATAEQYLSAEAVVLDEFYSPGDVISLGGQSWPTAKMLEGFITSSACDVVVNLQTPKNLRFISSISCSSFIVEARGIAGYLNSKSGYNEYVGVDGYTVTCYKIDDYSIKIRINKSTAWTNTTNNTPVALMGQIDLILVSDGAKG